MYLVRIDNAGAKTVIHGDFCAVADCKVSIEKNAIPSMTFGIYPGNPGYGLLTEFATLIECIDRQTGETVFEGRVLSASASMDSDGCAMKSVTCEGLAAYLCDSRQPYAEERNWPGDESRTGLQQFVDFLLANHNAKMPAAKRISRGVVDLPTFKTTESVTKGTNFERTYDIVSEKLVGVFGGEFQVRRGDDGLLYFDYREKLGEQREEPIALGRNIESASREMKPDQLITRLYPRGCKLKTTEVDESGAEREVETEERLNISTATGGPEYIDDAEAMKLYGVIEGTNEWDDVTDPVHLKDKAERWLEENNKLPVSTTISGVDLSLLGLEPRRIRAFDWYPCRNELIGLDESLEVVKQVIDVSEPANSTWEFGDSAARQSGAISGLQRVAGDVQVVKSQVKTATTNIGNAVTYTKAAIEVSEKKITATVQELRSNQESMQATIEAMPDSIKLEVTQGYTEYVAGQLKPVNESISSLQLTATGLESSVRQLESGYGACTTAGATAEKSVSIQGFFDCHKGATVCVKFSYANTAASPTLNVNGTGAMPIYLNGSAITKDYWWGAGDTFTFVFTGSAWAMSDAGAKSKIKQLANSISLEVSGKLGGTASIVMSVDGAKTTQSIDMTGVRDAFKNDTTAITISAGAVTFNSNTFVVNSTHFSVTKTGVVSATSGKIGGFTLTSSSIYNDMLTLYSKGMRLKYSTSSGAKDIGLIGANGLDGDASKAGLNFDLEPTGDYMTLAAKKSSSDSYYSMFLTYANKSLTVSDGSVWDAGRLHIACGTDFHGYILSNAWIDPDTGGANGGITGTLNFTQMWNVTTNGTYTFANGCFLKFKNGILIGGTWNDH